MKTRSINAMIEIIRDAGTAETMMLAELASEELAALRAENEKYKTALVHARASLRKLTDGRETKQEMMNMAYGATLKADEALR